MDVYRKIDKCPKCNRDFPGGCERNKDNFEIHCAYCGYSVEIPVSELLLHFYTKSDDYGCDSILKAEGDEIKTYEVKETSKAEQPGRKNAIDRFKLWLYHSTSKSE